MRIGFGYDIHELVPERKLILGGVIIPSPVGEKAYSDGDVLIHAVIDAILGAAAAGDIGSHFPNSDPAYKNISSRILLKTAGGILTKNNYKIVNIDSTIILQKPHILEFIPAIRSNLSNDLNIPLSSVSVKGKTKEKLDAAGKGKAIEVYAVALIELFNL